MKCEEFARVGLDRREAAASYVDRKTLVAAMEHADTCMQCAALLRSWHAARTELQLLRAATENAETPTRVEMKLRQAIRDQEGRKRSTFAMFSAWALATAAIWLAVASWRSWRDEHSATKRRPAPVAVNDTAQNSGVRDLRKPSVPGTGSSPEAAQPSGQDTYSAEDLNDFTFLPGSIPVENGDSEILRVRLQREALAALGLPVNEERAGEWLQVDLLVTEDGQPQAVRLGR